jgi:hypothetical protein
MSMGHGKIEKTGHMLSHNVVHWIRRFSISSDIWKSYPFSLGFPEPPKFHLARIVFNLFEMLEYISRGLI